MHMPFNLRVHPHTLKIPPMDSDISEVEKGRWSVSGLRASYARRKLNVRYATKIPSGGGQGRIDYGGGLINVLSNGTLSFVDLNRWDLDGFYWMYGVG
jgi:hypothetical protein